MLGPAEVAPIELRTLWIARPHAFDGECAFARQCIIRQRDRDAIERFTNRALELRAACRVRRADEGWNFLLRGQRAAPGEQGAEAQQRY